MIHTKEACITGRLPDQPTKHVAITIDLKFALPWHQDCYQGIMHYAEQQGWRCSLDLYAVGEQTGDSPSGYDGVIGRITDEVAQRVQGQGLPVVNLRAHIAPNFETQFKQLPGVYIDRDAAIRLSVEHLALNGYKRVGAMAMLADDQWHVIQTLDAAGAAIGLERVEPHIFPGDFADTLQQHVAALASLKAWLACLVKPVGVMVIHPNISRLVAHACLELGLRVPEDVGIITPVGDQVFTTSGWPTISAVEFDHYKQGYEAAALLDKLMRGEVADPLQKWLSPAGLVVRDSTDVFLCEDKLVSAAMRYIAAHMREELTVQQLAEAMDVSRSTLHRRFEEVLGRPPQQEISRLRLDNIKRLLSQTDRPIGEIIAMCGFSTASHFSRYFKQQTGETPSDYRKRHRARI